MHIDIIVSLLKENKLSQKHLCDYLGISKSVFTDWKAGRNNSYVKFLPQIAEYFNVSTDYLLGKTDIKNKPTTSEDGELVKVLQDPIKREILETYNKLTPERQKIALAQLKVLLENEDT